MTQTEFGAFGTGYDQLRARPQPLQLPLLYLISSFSYLMNSFVSEDAHQLRTAARTALRTRHFVIGVMAALGTVTMISEAIGGNVADNVDHSANHECFLIFHATSRAGKQLHLLSAMDAKGSQTPASVPHVLKVMT